MNEVVELESFLRRSTATGVKRIERVQLPYLYEIVRIHTGRVLNRKNLESLLTFEHVSHIESSRDGLVITLMLPLETSESNSLDCGVVIDWNPPVIYCKRYSRKVTPDYCVECMEERRK